MKVNFDSDGWFYRNTLTGEVEGPFELAELEGLFRDGTITGETLTRAEREEAWLPFRDRREFKWIGEKYPSIARRPLETEAEEPKTLFVLRWLYGFGALVIGVAGYTFCLFFWASGPSSISSPHGGDLNHWLAWWMLHLKH